MQPVPPSGDHPAAPPTSPVSYMPPPPGPAWPTVLGILSIVLGSIGAVFAFFTVVGQLVISLSPFMGRTGVPPVAVDFLRAQAPRLIAINAVVAVLAAMLLICGIGLLRRLRWSIRMIRIWGVLKLLAAAGQAWINYDMQTRQLQVFRSIGNPAVAFSFYSTMPAFTSAFWFVVQAAVPVFMLIWFSRAKIRDQAATWR